MPSVFKKFIFSFLSFLVIFFSIAPYFPAFAIGGAPPSDSTTSTSGGSFWYNPGLLEFYGKVYDTSNNDIFGERYTYAQVVWILESLPFALLGIVPNTFQEILRQFQSDPTGMNLFSDPNSKLVQLKDPFTEIISQFYSSPPASGSYWLTQKINHFGLVKRAYAAPTNSFGYSSLLIFEPVWSASRNFAYSLIVIILLSIAFAVMFRLKISPQVVVTVQSALPKIAITLILVTFSYAIAGFLIDLMYLIFGALIYGISNSASAVTNLGLDPKLLFDDFLNGNIITKAFTNPVVATTTGGLGLGLIGSIVGLILLSGATAGTGVLVGLAAFGAIIPFILGLIVAIIIFFFKTFIMLAQTYVSLVINIVFAPIIILAEAIPFVKANAMGWFRSLLADITVFLAVGLIFVVQSLLNASFDQTTSTAPWSPPYLGFHPIIMKIVIWIGVWSILPNVRQSVYEIFEKKQIRVETPREFGGTGESLSRAWSNFSSRLRNS